MHEGVGRDSIARQSRTHEHRLFPSLHVYAGSICRNQPSTPFDRGGMLTRRVLGVLQNLGDSKISTATLSSKASLGWSMHNQLWLYTCTDSSSSQRLEAAVEAVNPSIGRFGL